jgi:hypothetical protein
MVATYDAIERELGQDGLIRRTPTRPRRARCCPHASGFALIVAADAIGDAEREPPVARVAQAR